MRIVQLWLVVFCFLTRSPLCFVLDNPPLGWDAHFGGQIFCVLFTKCHLRTFCYKTLNYLNFLSKRNWFYFEMHIDDPGFVRLVSTLRVLNICVLQHNILSAHFFISIMFQFCIQLWTVLYKFCFFFCKRYCQALCFTHFQGRFFYALCVAAQLCLRVVRWSHVLYCVSKKYHLQFLV